MGSIIIPTSYIRKLRLRRINGFLSGKGWNFLSGCSWVGMGGEPRFADSGAQIRHHPILVPYEMAVFSFMMQLLGFCAQIGTELILQ